MWVAASRRRLARSGEKEGPFFRRILLEKKTLQGRPARKEFVARNSLVIGDQSVGHEIVAKRLQNFRVFHPRAGQNTDRREVALC